MNTTWRRVGTVAAVAVAGLAAALGATAAQVRAQERRVVDAGEPADPAAAEAAYLKGYFAERELRDAEKAAAEYARAAETPGASRDVAARALAGRVRCLRTLGRAADAETTLERLRSAYADVLPAPELAALAPTAAADEGTPSGVIESLVDQASEESVAAIAEYGERAVPVLQPFLRSQVPSQVRTASRALRAIGGNAARGVLESGIADPAIPYPRQVAAALFVGSGPHWGNDASSGLPLGVRAGLRHPDAEIRRWALQSIQDGPPLPDDVAQIVLADAELAADAVRRGFRKGARWGGFLLAAVTSGRAELRDAALEEIRKLQIPTGSLGSHYPYAGPFYDPPPAFLADAEAVATVYASVYRHHMADSVAPSQALVSRLASEPRTAAIAAAWIIMARNRTGPVDGRALAAAVLRCAEVEQPETAPQSGSETGERLVAAFVGPDKDAVLAAHARVWPWTFHPPWLFTELDRRNALDAATVRGVFAGLRNPKARAATVAWFQKLRTSSPDVAERFPARDEILAELLDDADPGVARAALVELSTRKSSTAAHPMSAATLRRFLAQAERSAAASPAAIAAIDYAAAQGPAGREMLAAELRPDAPFAGAILEALEGPDVPGLESRLVEILRSSEEQIPVRSALHRLLASRRGDALDVLQPLLADGSDALWGVLRSDIGRILDSLGPVPAEQLLIGVFRGQPGRLRLLAGPVDGAEARRNALLGRLPPDARLRVLRAAIRSSDVADRRWAAWAFARSLGDAAWDDLLVAAEDADGDTRTFAREGLRWIQTSRAEMDRFRSAAESRRVRGRIDSLLADAKPDARRAGIAAVVATRSVDRIPELLTIALDDPDDGVRSEARQALMALGTSDSVGRPAPEPAAPDDPPK